MSDHDQIKDVFGSKMKAARVEIARSAFKNFN